MEFLTTLFGTKGLASTLLFLCAAGFIGVWLGKIKFKNIKLGIAGVLFSGIAIAHFAAKGGTGADEHILHFLRDFGLILFVYSIGVDMGPRFFNSFKKDGLLLNIFAASIALLGFGIALSIYYLTDLNIDVVVGILCGAVTNTPSLGAAQQLLGDVETTAGMSYAVAYPLGILGIILTMGIVRMVFRINIDKEVSDYNHTLGGQRNKLQSVEVTISNPNVFGKQLSDIQELLDGELATSRIYRNEAYILATDSETLQQGDVLYGVSAQQYLEDLRLKLGEVAITGSKEITGQMSIKNILLTNRSLAGKTIEQVGIYRRYPANITRIFRNGMEILPTRNTTVELGDTLKVVGAKAALTDIKNELGDSVKELAIPHIVPIFLGIFLGIILGSISIYIPGLPAPAKLGLAGGPLLVAILLGHKGRIGKMSFYMTPGANLMLREMGIILFLACVGLLSGGKFVETIVNGGWVWIIYGVIITLVPIILVSFVARFFFKVNYLKICGFISGSMTDPPALEFANGIAPTQAQSTAYATVYPITMFMRILLAQLLILVAM